jgi:hypothetical protein
VIVDVVQRITNVVLTRHETEYLAGVVGVAEFTGWSCMAARGAVPCLDRDPLGKLGAGGPAAAPGLNNGALLFRATGWRRDDRCKSLPRLSGAVLAWRPSNRR